MLNRNKRRKIINRKSLSQECPVDTKVLAFIASQGIPEGTKMEYNYIKYVRQQVLKGMMNAGK